MESSNGGLAHIKIPTNDILAIFSVYGEKEIILQIFGYRHIIALAFCLQRNPRLLHLPRKRLRGIPLIPRGLFVTLLYEKINNNSFASFRSIYC